MQKNIFVLFKKKEECSGCTVCYVICPNNAISMVEDKEQYNTVLAVKSRITNLDISE